MKKVTHIAKAKVFVPKNLEEEKGSDQEHAYILMNRFRIKQLKLK
jgi:hypothetical protein